MKENKISKKFLALGLRNYYSNATLEVTNRCNASCSYCYISDKNSLEIPLNKMYTVLDKLTEAGIATLAITGGEPFIREDILDILRYCIKKDFWHITIMTNGALITEHQIDFLIRHKEYISSLQFPLFSRHPAVHDKYLGVDGALLHMLSVAEKLKREGIYIHLAYNMMDFNIGEFKETYSLYRDQGYDMRTGIIKIKTKENQNTCEFKKYTSCDFYRSLLTNAPDKYIENEKKRFLKGVNNKIPISETLVCKGIYKNICISPNGDMYPCNSFRNLKIGNILDNGSLYELLDSSETLGKIKKMRRSDIYPCNKCKYSRSCSICLGLIHTETGEMNRVSQQICRYANAVEKCL